MKKILGLTISALLIMCVVGGGTWAYFSDTETSLGNTWTAGTLNLVDVISGMAVNTDIIVTEQGDGLNDKVVFGSVTPLVPGSSGTITWTLSNTGNLPGLLTMVATTTFDQGGAPNEPEAAAETALGGVKGLDTGVMVWVTRGGVEVFGTAAIPVAMSGLAAFLSSQSQSIAGGGSLVYVLHWQIPTAVGNEIQGDSATLNITFALTQS